MILAPDTIGFTYLLEANACTDGRICVGVTAENDLGIFASITLTFDLDHNVAGR